MSDDRAEASDELPEVPGYRVLRRIAQGGMGVVLLAEPETRRGTRVALKLLRDDVVLDTQILQRFRREGRVAAELEHPHILAVRAVHAWEGGSALVMDHVAGRPLDASILRRPQAVACDDATTFPLARVLTMVADVADALQHAHAHGVVHRDVKPGNVLVREDGHPFLLDFGLARQLDSESALTTSRMLMGTPRYMSPEQILGRWQDVGPRSDVWSLGATLFHVLAGRPPFEGRDLEELQARIVFGPPPSLVDVPGVPRTLDTVVRRALGKLPEDRYESAAAFADDLRRVAAGRRPRRRPAAEVRATARRWRDRLRRAALPVVSALLALAALLTWHAFSSADEERAARHRAALLSAQMAVDAGDLDGVVAAVGEADALRPDDPLGQLLLAGAQGDFGRFDEVDAALAEARRRGFDPERRDTPMALLGAALYATRVSSGTREALALAERAAHDDPTLDAAWLLAYRLRRSLRDDAGARTDLAAFRHRLPGDHPLAPLVDALLHELDGRPEQALAALDALASDPRAASGLRLDRERGRLELALALRTSDVADVTARLDAAQRLLEGAVLEGPSDSWARLNLASVHLVRDVVASQAGELDVAAACAREVLDSGRRGVPRVRALELLAEVAHRRARRALYGPDAANALAAFDAANDELRALDPGGDALPRLESRALTLRAETRAAEGSAVSCPIFGRAVALDPDNVEARARMGQDLYMLGDFDGAGAAFDEVVARLDARDAGAAFSRSERGWLPTSLVWSFGIAAQRGDVAAGRRARERLEALLDAGATLKPEDEVTWIEFLGTSPCRELEDCAKALDLLDGRDALLSSLPLALRRDAAGLLDAVRVRCGSRD